MLEFLVHFGDSIKLWDTVRGCCGPSLRYVYRLCTCSLKAIMRLWSSRCMLYDGVVCMFFDQSDGVSIGKCNHVGWFYCRVLLCLVRAFCCRVVRFGGWLLQSVGRLLASICFVLSM